jgi:hypothetical protein
VADCEYLYAHYPGLRALDPARPNDRRVFENEMERVQTKMDRVRALLDTPSHNMPNVTERRLRRSLDHLDAIETQLFRLLSAIGEHAPTAASRG